MITETLLRSSGTIKTRIIVFYQRRIRRIFPASIYATCITLLSTFLFLPRIYSKNFILDAVSALFMVANLRFAQSGINYLQETLHSNPFLHLWSLGVGEQFYLLWPVIAILFFYSPTIGRGLALILFLASLVTTKFVTENIENPIRFRQKYLKSRKFWITLIVPVLGMFIFAFAQGFSLTQNYPFTWILQSL